MKKKKHDRTPPIPEKENAFALTPSSVASATECTGLVPAAVRGPSESASYYDILPTPLPTNTASHDRDGKPLPRLRPSENP